MLSTNTTVTITDENFLLRRFRIADDENAFLGSEIIWKRVKDKIVPTSALYKLKPAEESLSFGLVGLIDPEGIIVNPRTQCAIESSAGIYINNGCQVENDHDSHVAVSGDVNSFAKEVSLNYKTCHCFETIAENTHSLPL